MSVTRSQEDPGWSGAEGMAGKGAGWSGRALCALLRPQPWWRVHAHFIPENSRKNCLLTHHRKSHQITTFFYLLLAF